MVLSLLAGALTSCGDKQSGENAERYHINFSETTTVQKENKYVLIISGSPRKGGNTDLLCDAFARGAEEVGGRVEKIFLADYRIDYFSEADEQRVGNRANEAEDDVPVLVDKMVRADVIVLARVADMKMKLIISVNTFDYETEYISLCSFVAVYSYHSNRM